MEDMKFWINLHNNLGKIGCIWSFLKRCNKIQKNNLIMTISDILKTKSQISNLIMAAILPESDIWNCKFAYFE